MLYPAIEKIIRELLREADRIPEPRKLELQQLADYIGQRLEQDLPVQLNFICTHNSRRSHLGQIWAAVAATYFALPGIKTFSGGTEATAFNPRAVAALERIGFRIQPAGGENPRYEIRYSDTATPLTAWSKTYNDPSNPAREFAAIMTCSDADENCPFIPGAELRLPLTYRDPKEADGTPQEGQRYDERARQIGRELLWAMQLVAQNRQV
ncbi:low molecular weight phosphatase family protein [Flavilitoribacter nigricans]|uniref:Protein-tyrosine-phosphatase n=1 Tax=Flavilitoribacter nigricans (strain ATCC 23147 / DSM 23189 / NBRC 102662 / NCIMB 1420 / SS-2) TaxID=1122177 RepID=A0A2D0N6E3_FLAN2|nr:protein-tyrosine-phosphatase [Flavilitoribacter nigricans]PHN03950.1 protein-tyrosine-phosphatase [Flavilitoribacter nigricans DSM 23189 = NBRC 102662]